jgi:hypothetical protein
MRPLGAPYGPSERTSTTLVVVSLRLAATPRLGPRARQCQTIRPPGTVASLRGTLCDLCAAGCFGAFCALWLFIVAERRGALAAVRLAVAIARICQAAARIREQRLIL